MVFHGSKNTWLWPPPLSKHVPHAGSTWGEDLSPLRLVNLHLLILPELWQCVLLPCFSSSTLHNNSLCPPLWTQGTMPASREHRLQRQAQKTKILSSVLISNGVGEPVGGEEIEYKWWRKLKTNLFWLFLRIFWSERSKAENRFFWHVKNTKIVFLCQ